MSSSSNRDIDGSSYPSKAPLDDVTNTEPRPTRNVSQRRQWVDRLKFVNLIVIDSIFDVALLSLILSLFFLFRLYINSRRRRSVRIESQIAKENGTNGMTQGCVFGCFGFDNCAIGLYALLFTNLLFFVHSVLGKRRQSWYKIRMRRKDGKLNYF